MVDVKKFSEIDLYGLIDVDIGATESEIRKAYRKKALQCHPDKNPDNPQAAERFLQLSKALEILLDVSARAAYDRLLNAKKAAKLRTKQLDGKRQKLKEELEERERAAKERDGVGKYRTAASKTPEELFEEEFERLRKESSRLLQEEQELMLQQLREEQSMRQARASASWDASQHRVKIRWKVAKGDTTNGGYSEEVLQKFLSKYGDLNVLVMNPKKGGSALAEFKTQEAAEMAVAYELGRLDNPCALEWIGDAPKSKTSSRRGTSSTVTDRDFESIVLRQLRQAEERKRLIEQMMKEDAEEASGS